MPPHSAKIAAGTTVPHLMKNLLRQFRPPTLNLGLGGAVASASAFLKAALSKISNEQMHKKTGTGNSKIIIVAQRE